MPEPPVMPETDPKETDPKDMDAVFKALADPSRRRMLDRLNARSGQT